ncbi:MAG: hypothetical protein KIS87_07335 [Phycisphaeraceae bacterium]|nr:hypothetical protein [Phycisphaeraceae bacterium]
MRQAMSGLLVFGFAVSAVVGQVAPPPPPVPEERPVVEPPPPPTQTHPTAERPPRPEMPSILDTPFESIAVLGADGKIVRLDEPIEIVALGNNPLVGYYQLAWMSHSLYLRRLKIEQIVIDNLDKIEALDEGGLIDSVKLGGDQAAAAEHLSKVMAAIQAVNSDGMMLQSIQRQGHVTRVIMELNQRIQNDYQSKVIAEMQATPQVEGAPSSLDLLTRQALRDSISEALYWRSRMMLEVAENADQVFGSLDLSPDVKAKIGRLTARLATTNNLDDREAIVREAFAALTLDQRRQALRAAIALRPEVDPYWLFPAPHRDTKFVEMTNDIRREIIWKLLDGVFVDESLYHAPGE